MAGCANLDASQQAASRRIPVQITTFAAAAAVLFFLASGTALQAEEDTSEVQDGSTVGIEYTLTLSDGSVADTNVGGEPLVYVQGEQQILPALEAQLLGMKPDETRDVVLTPEEGYGPVQPEALQTVPLEIIPEEARQVGARLMGQGPHGEPVHAKVTEIGEDTALIDVNHPLAGETLHFSITVRSIE
jgi:FKBP-type peptidyl-prolyl cis-trans isomerase SlyD